MDLVDQVVGLFEQQTPTFINEIEMATRESDAAETRRVAHAYKSSANNIDAVVLARRLAEIEASARDEQRVLKTEEVNELDGLVRESLRQLLAAYVRLPLRVCERRQRIALYHSDRQAGGACLLARPIPS